MSTSGQWKLARVIRLYLGLAWWATVVGAVLLVLSMGVVWVYVEPDRGEALDMPLLVRFTMDEPVLQLTSPEIGLEESLPLTGQGEITLYTRSGRAWALTLGLIAVIFGVVLYTLWQLRSLFAAISAGEPFRAENAGRVRRIGLVVVGWNLAAPVAKYFGTLAVLDQFAVEGMTLEPPIDVDPNLIFVGLAILVLGEILQRAARIHEDQALTI